MIFVSKVARCNELNRLLTECNFPSICIHGGMTQEERIKKYKSFKEVRVGDGAPRKISDED